MFDLEMANLKPEEISPQNRRAACYLHYDLATIADRLCGLSCLLKALSSSEMQDYYLREVPGALGLASTVAESLSEALDTISGDIARPHGLSTTLVAPDWWKQVEDRGRGGGNAMDDPTCNRPALEVLAP